MVFPLANMSKQNDFQLGSNIKLYCESSNAHYVQLQAPAHANFSGNVTVTLPNTTGTLATVQNTASKGFAVAMAIAL